MAARRRAPIRNASPIRWEELLVHVASSRIVAAYEGQRPDDQQTRSRLSHGRWAGLSHGRWAGRRCSARASVESDGVCLNHRRNRSKPNSTRAILRHLVCADASVDSTSACPAKISSSNGTLRIAGRSQMTRKMRRSSPRSDPRVQANGGDLTDRDIERIVTAIREAPEPLAWHRVLAIAFSGLIIIVLILYLASRPPVSASFQGSIADSSAVLTLGGHSSVTWSLGPAIASAIDLDSLGNEPVGVSLPVRKQACDALAAALGAAKCKDNAIRVYGDVRASWTQPQLLWPLSSSGSSTKAAVQRATSLTVNFAGPSSRTSGEPDGRALFRPSQMMLGVVNGGPLTWCATQVIARFGLLISTASSSFEVPWRDISNDVSCENGVSVISQGGPNLQGGPSQTTFAGNPDVALQAASESVMAEGVGGPLDLTADGVDTVPSGTTLSLRADRDAVVISNVTLSPSGVLLTLNSPRLVEATDYGPNLVMELWDRFHPDIVVPVLLFVVASSVRGLDEAFIFLGALFKRLLNRRGVS